MRIVTILFFVPAPADYLPRHSDAALATALRSAPIVLLDGARGVGKTTSAQRLAASSVRLPDDIEQLRVDPAAYLRSLAPPVLLDEWQLAGTDILWTLKRIVDDDPTPGRFILAGSVEPATYGPTYPLTGRAVRIVMRPMTWAELNGRGAQTSVLTQLLAGTPPILGQSLGDDFDLSRLGTPGFPAARALPDPRHFLDAYAAATSQRAGDEGRDASRLLRAMRVLATLTGQAVPDQRVWEAADITKITWKGYDDLLVRVHFSAALPAFETNRLKRLTAYPKRFLSDTAMALALSGLTVDDLRSNPTTAGRYLESFVLQQVRPLVDALGGAAMHLRTGAGEREVDLVIEMGGPVVGIEVKNGTRPGLGDARHLEWMRDQVGDRFAFGLVLHTGRDAYPLSDGITAFPIGLLAG